MTPFREYLPKIVRRYLVLRESAGLHGPDSEWYQLWTGKRKEVGQHRWFDHDHALTFAGTSLVLVHRQRHHTYQRYP